MSAFAGGETSTLSGLAGEIRRATESEQFDLANYTEARVRDLIKATFSTPLDAPTTMVRFTFVVGGGKLVRAKYNDDLPKWTMTALRELVNYKDDKSAAETFDSQGSYKYQHDTGANLKYVIVYPQVTCAAAATAATSSSAATGSSTAPTAMDTTSPEYLVMTASLSTMQDMVRAKVTSWRQKKKLLKVLQEQIENFNSISTKLMSGKPIDATEQAVYDANCGEDAEKVAWLQNEIKNMVAHGILTASEKAELLETISSNIATVAAEGGGGASAAASANPKLVALQTRKANIEKITPISHPLRYADDIIKLRVRLLALLALEARGRTNSLTLADLKLLEEKPDVAANIERYEAASKGWFLCEENGPDAEFTEQCALLEKEAQKKYEKKLASMNSTKGKSSASKSSGSSGGSWNMTGSSGGRKAGSSAASKPAPKSNFASAFVNDSDSD